MTWRAIGGVALNQQDGIRVTRHGRDTLRYDEGPRYLEFTLESNHPLVSIYVDETHAWAPAGEPFTSDERVVVEQQLLGALRALGYSEIDLGREPRR